MQSNKLKELSKYSNPEYVMHKAKMIGLNPVHESSRKDKKYMVFDGRKMVHFGQMGFEDASKHRDLDRINRFKKKLEMAILSKVYSRLVILVPVMVIKLF